VKGAVVVGALAVGAVAVGAPVAAVTGVLGVLAVAGGAALGYDTIGQIRSGNWAGVAYNAGSVLGSAAVGGGGGRAIAEGINEVASPAWSWASDVAQRFNPSLGSVGQWLGTGPNPGSAGGSPLLLARVQPKSSRRGASYDTLGLNDRPLLNSALPRTPHRAFFFCSPLFNARCCKPFFTRVRISTSLCQ
jgi:hypothetical protein